MNKNGKLKSLYTIPKNEYVTYMYTMGTTCERKIYNYKLPKLQSRNQGEKYVPKN